VVYLESSQIGETALKTTNGRNVVSSLDFLKNFETCCDRFGFSLQFNLLTMNGTIDFIMSEFTLQAIR
jgi:hypothetical protein